MAKEIERKFLVSSDSYLQMYERKISIVQAYLSVSSKATVRVRITDDRAYLTVKSKTHGFSRDEWEYEIPVEDARGMLGCCQSAIIEKVRYVVPYQGYKWEVGRFGGVHDGLVVAEIELPDESAQFALPSFVGEEVTGNPIYYNSVLARLAEQK